MAKHSQVIAAKILEIAALANKIEPIEKRNQMFADAFWSMGPGCIFDDIVGDSEEELGALHILNWILAEFKPKE